MTKKLLTLILIFSLLGVNSVFAFRWFEDGDDWYVVDEEKGEFLESTMLDTGSNVYFLNETGKMVTGWYRSKGTGKYYFFSNKKDKDYGGMVFGLHMIDGYYRYFDDDGTLAFSSEKGSYKKVYGDYFADDKGLLYKNNVLQRDETILKSEFYTNSIYYDEPLLNNYFLANFDTSFRLLDIEPKNTGNDKNASKDGNNRTKTGSNTDGGVNYSIDDNGQMHITEAEVNLSEFERKGPSVHLE